MGPSFPFCYSWDLSYPSDLPRGGWFNLVRVCVVIVYDCKPMLAVFFFFLGGGGRFIATLAEGRGMGEHLRSFGQAKCLQGYSKTL